jgi:hypothetical protein
MCVSVTWWVSKEGEDFEMPFPVTPPPSPRNFFERPAPKGTTKIIFSYPQKTKRIKGISLCFFCCFCSCSYSLPPTLSISVRTRSNCPAPLYTTRRA